MPKRKKQLIIYYLLFIFYYLLYSEAFCGSLKIWLMTARTKISPPPLAQQNYSSFHPTRYYKFIFAIIKKCPCIKILHLSIVQGRGDIKKNVRLPPNSYCLYIVYNVHDVEINLQKHICQIIFLFATEWVPRKYFQFKIFKVNDSSFPF